MGRKSYQNQNDDQVKDPLESLLPSIETQEEPKAEEPEVLNEQADPVEIPTEINEEPIPTQEEVKPENIETELNTSEEMEKVKKEEVIPEIEIPTNSDKIVGIPKRSSFYKKLKGSVRRTH